MRWNSVSGSAKQQRFFSRRAIEGFLFAARLAPLALAVSIAFGAGGSAESVSHSVAGQSVASVLREARSIGIRIIFTDQLVPPDLRVSEEPRARDPLPRLQEILRGHSLTLEEVSPNVYVVKRGRLAPGKVLPTIDPLAQVEVTASRYTIDTLSPGESLSLVGADLDRQPALFDDATRSIRQFPGTAGQDLSSRTSVRGGMPEDNLILLDGVPLYDPWHLPGLPLSFSVIDPIAIGRLDFYSGVVPVEYGDRMGALVNMHLREPTDKLSGRVAFGTLDASAYASGPLASDQGDWLVLGRKGFLGRSVNVPNWEVGQPQLLDTLGRVRYHFDNGGTLTVGGLTARDHANFTTSFDTLIVLDDASDRTYAWTAYEKQWDSLQSRTTLSYTSARTNRDGAASDVGGFAQLHDDRQYRSALLQQNWVLPFSEWGTMRWGGSIREERAQYDYYRALHFLPEAADFFHRSVESVSLTNTSVALHEQEAYWALNRGIGSRLTLDAGVHLSAAEYSTDQHAFTWDPRLSLRFDVSDATRLRLSSGRMSQVASAAEFPIEQDRTRFDEPAISTQHVLAFEHDFGQRAAVRAEVFDRRISNPRPRFENIFFPYAFLPEIRVDRMLIEPESARMRGADLYLTAHLTQHLQGWMSYSYSNAFDLIGGKETPREWDQPHAAALGLTAEGRSWMLSAAAFGHSAWPQTPLETEFIDATNGNLGWIRKIGARASARDGRYISLNLKAGYRVRFPSGSLHLTFEAANATNRDNLCCNELQFNEFNGTVIDETTNRRDWLPVMMYGTVSWEFGDET